MGCRSLAYTIVVGAVLSSTLRAQASPSPTDSRLAGFDEYVAKSVKDWNVAGLAIAVVKDGRVVFEKAYGVRQLGRPEPVDTATLFNAASTTKAMTAVAVGMLVDEGKLQWDDPVIKHLPGFQLYDPYVTRELTIRDLLTHRAGLGNADYLWASRDLSRDTVISRLRFVKPAYSLRSSFVYQNLMYLMAGEVIRAVSGMPWETFVATRIFQPLGMTSTVPLSAMARGRADVASPHWRFGDTLTLIKTIETDVIAPAGSVVSSISDMSKWIRFLLDSAKVGGKRLLKPETFAELFTPQAIVPPDEFYPTRELTKPHWMTYGLGWFQHDYRGHMVDFHTGSINGFVAIAGLLRDERLGVYVFANTDHVEVRHALMYRVFDLFLGAPVRDWSTEIRALYGKRTARADSSRTADEAKRIRGTKPSLPEAKYVGTYSDQLLGKIIISMENGNLRARMSSSLAGSMEQWQYDTFRIRWDNRWDGTDLVTFSIGQDGLPETVTLGDFILRRETKQ
jgi:CubicO group peptidase (beta-lactamase class C family)